MKVFIFYILAIQFPPNRRAKAAPVECAVAVGLMGRGAEDRGDQKKLKPKQAAFNR
jgi:hypothetical protein